MPILGGFSDLGDLFDGGGAGGSGSEYFSGTHDDYLGDYESRHWGADPNAQTSYEIDVEDSHSNGGIGGIIDQVGDAAERNGVSSVSGKIAIGNAEVEFDIEFDDTANFLDSGVSLNLDSSVDYEDVIETFFSLGSSTSFSIVEEDHGSGEYSNIFVSNTSDAFLILERVADDQTIEGSASADNLNGQSGHDLMFGLATGLVISKTIKKYESKYDEFKKSGYWDVR